MIGTTLPRSPADSPAAQAEFERHVKRAYPLIYRHAYRLLRDRSDAEEVTQDAFVRAWKHFSSYDGERRFENWVLRIVTNLVIDRKRRHPHPTCSLDASVFISEEGAETRWDPPDPDAGPARQVLDRTIDPAIVSALGELSTTFRKVLLMAEVQEYSYREIADAMRCPVGTVRSRLRRARMQMRRSLEARGFSPASIIH